MYGSLHWSRRARSTVTHAGRPHLQSSAQIEKKSQPASQRLRDPGAANQRPGPEAAPCERAAGRASVAMGSRAPQKRAAQQDDEAPTKRARTGCAPPAQASTRLASRSSRAWHLAMPACLGASWRTKEGRLCCLQTVIAVPRVRASAGRQHRTMCMLQGVQGVRTLSLLTLFRT